MIEPTVDSAARVAHDFGMAAWSGETLFGKVAFNSGVLYVA